jgi:hypothetical protein
MENVDRKTSRYDKYECYFERCVSIVCYFFKLNVSASGTIFVISEGGNVPA